MNRELPNEWATHFGLAPVPLFAADSVEDGAVHSVLLDGGFGSFAVSVTEEQPWRERRAASWAWSSNLPHHVTVTDRKVAVTRWDNPQVEVLSRHSVESQLDAFYKFLRTDRVRSNQTVVDHVLTLFRQVRSLIAGQGMDDANSVKAFLGVLTRLIEETKSGTKSNTWPSGDEAEALVRSLPNGALTQLIRDAREASLALRLDPALAVRHAGSAIFQEAHFALLRAPAADLFGYAGVAQSQQTTRGGAHFTPAALARIVVEQAIAQVAVADTVGRAPASTNAFTFLVANWLDVLEKYGFDVDCYISNFSFEKIRLEIAQMELDFSSRLGSVMGDSTAKFLALPLPIAVLAAIYRAYGIVEAYLLFIGALVIVMLFSGMIHNQLLQLARIDHGFGVIGDQFSKKAKSYPASIADRLAEARNGFAKQRSFLFRTLWALRVLAWGPIVAGVALLAWKYSGFGSDLDLDGIWVFNNRLPLRW